MSTKRTNSRFQSGGVFRVRPAPGVDLNVGDIVGSGISLPCTTFDKWRAIPLIDSNYDVVGAIRTFFQNPSAVHRAGPNPLRGRGGYRVLGRTVLQVTCPLGEHRLTNSSHQFGPVQIVCDQFGLVAVDRLTRWFPATRHRRLRVEQRGCPQHEASRFFDYRAHLARAD